MPEDQAELQDCVRAVEELNERLLLLDKKISDVQNDLTMFWSDLLIRVKKLEAERVKGL